MFINQTPEARAEALARAHEASAKAKEERDASEFQLGPFTIRLDAPPGIGWKATGPRDFERYYATREIAVARVTRHMAEDSIPMN